MIDFKCDDGYTYRFPDGHCSGCKNCTDVFWDYTNGPYMFICNIGENYDWEKMKCDKYEIEED